MKKQNGFTIIEALLASVLIGIGISALIAANAAMSRVNIAGTQLATAQYLLEQVREMTETTRYEHLSDDDFDPAVDVLGTELADFDMYSQHITVRNVAANNFDNIVAAGSSDFVKITAQVKRRGQTVTSTSWIRARY